jgi:hypothetical protein
VACAFCGLIWFELISAVGASSGGTTGVAGAILGPSASAKATGGHVSILALVVALITRPQNWIGNLWGNRVDILATIGPGGVIGALEPAVVGIVGVILLQANLAGRLFSTPGFQQFPVAPLTAVGTILIVSWAVQKWVNADLLRLRLAWVGIAFICVNSALWAAIWIPAVPGRWLHTSSAQASVLTSFRSAIPLDAEVVASNGVVGGFAQREQVYACGESIVSDWCGRIPIRRRTVYFIVAPNAGIEGAAPAVALSAVGDLVNRLHAEVLRNQAGVFVLRWDAPAGTTALGPLGLGSSIPAWTVPGPGGAVEVGGAPPSWGVLSRGGPGYVVSGDYWTRPPGEYAFHVRFDRVGATFAVEVWNVSAKTLIARDQYVETGTPLDVTIPVRVTDLPNRNEPYSGLGAYTITPLAPPPGQVIELRIECQTPGGVKVSSISLRASER